MIAAPSEADMESFISAPSEQEMEDFLRGVTGKKLKKKKAKKPKPPCKYGPRGEDGRCPPKPKSSRKSSSDNSDFSSGSTRTESRAGTAERKSPSQLSGLTKPLSRSEAHKLGKTAAELAKIAADPTVRKNAAGAVSTAAAAATKVLKGAPIGAAASGGAAAAVGAGVATVAAGAIAAYAGVKAGLWLRGKLDDAKFRNSPEFRFQEARKAYRAAYADLEKQYGRRLTQQEDDILFENFYGHLRNAMPKGGF